jgi:DNA phosphorothioation-associated putative methyltransferase
LQQDIAVFWRSYAAAQGEVTRLLFSLGKTETIREACVAAAAEGIGYRDEDHSLQLHSSLVPRLPAVLRVYVGCASRLYGEVEAADLVKIHVQSGKLSLTTCGCSEWCSSTTGTRRRCSSCTASRGT